MVACIFGLPGSGKTLALTMLAQKALKKGRDVYTNFSCNGCRSFNVEDIGVANFDGALILIDEITLLWDSRGFKTFNNEVKEFFTMHRHFGIDIVYATQYYANCDKRIRDVTARTYLIKPGRFIGKLIRIPNEITIPEVNGEIIVGFRQPTKMEELFSTRFLRPVYYKYYNTNEGTPKQFLPQAERWTAPNEKKDIRNTISNHIRRHIFMFTRFSPPKPDSTGGERRRYNAE